MKVLWQVNHSAPKQITKWSYNSTAVNGNKQTVTWFHPTQKGAVLWCMDHHGCDEGGDGKFHFHIWLLVTLVKENQEVFPKWVMSLEILCHFTISYTGQTLALVSCHSNCVILLSTTLVILGPVPCCYCVIWLSTTLVTLGSVLCCNYCVILL